MSKSCETYIDLNQQIGQNLIQDFSVTNHDAIGLRDASVLLNFDWMPLNIFKNIIYATQYCENKGDEKIIHMYIGESRNTFAHRYPTQWSYTTAHKKVLIGINQNKGFIDIWELDEPAGHMDEEVLEDMTDEIVSGLPQGYSLVIENKARCSPFCQKKLNEDSLTSVINTLDRITQTDNNCEDVRLSLKRLFIGKALPQTIEATLDEYKSCVKKTSEVRKHLLTNSDFRKISSNAKRGRRGAIFHR